MERLEERTLLSAFALQDQIVGDRVEDVGVEDEALAGQAVAIDGDRMVVGAPEALDRGTFSGAAFVYRHSDNGTPDIESDDFWEQEARLTPGGDRYFDHFGSSVAISGTTIVVGSPEDRLDSDGDGDVDHLGAGSATVFTLDSATGEWLRRQTLTDDTPQFRENYGWAVAVSGGAIVVGSLHDSVDTDGDGQLDAYRVGSADVFTLDGESERWSRRQTLTAADAGSFDQFGYSVAISGGTILVGSPQADLDTDGEGGADAYNAGSASVFTFDAGAGQWTQQQTLTAAEPERYAYFGRSVAMSGGTIVVGSPRDDLDFDGDDAVDAFSAGSTSVFTFDSESEQWTRRQTLTTAGLDDRYNGDLFGSSVAISDGAIVVGSPRDDLDFDGDGGVDAYTAGSASVFTFDSESQQWGRRQTLNAADADSSDSFGHSVAISAGTLAIGSPYDDLDTDGDGVAERPSAGSAYVFGSNADGWTEEQKLLGVRRESGPESESAYGRHVAVDGDLMVVGAPFENAQALTRSGAAYVYRRDDNGTPLDVSDDSWRQEARLTAANPVRSDYFGSSVAISEGTIVVGSPRDDLDTDGDGAVDAYDTGSADIFAFDSAAGQWNRRQTLTAAGPDHDDEFGFSVAISDDETIVVGSPHNELDTDGDDEPDVYNAGSAYVFTFGAEGQQWNQQERLTASDPDGAPRPWYSDGDLFGSSVAISGGAIVVGSPRDSLEMGDDGVDARLAGSAYVFTFEGASGWTEQQKLTADVLDDFFAEFGSSVAISDGTIVIGSRRDSVDSDGDGAPDADNAGSADVFTFDSGTGLWSRRQTLTAANAREYEYFGSSVAISSRAIVVGSEFNDLDLDGDGAPDAHNAGSASVFVLDDDTGLWNRRQTLAAPDLTYGFNGGHFGYSVAISGGTIVVGSPDDDLDTDGDGMVDLPSAGSAYVFVDPPPAPPSVEVGDDLQSFVVQFDDDDLVRSLAEDPSNYRITAAGVDAAFGTDDDVALPIASAEYDSLADRVTVRTADAIFGDIFRLEIDGDDDADGTPGLTDLVGNHLAGGDVSAEFDLTALTLVEDLLADVSYLGLSTGPENSLTSKLDAVLKQLDMDTGDDQSLTAKMEAFIWGVQHWFEKGEIDSDDKDSLIADTEQILLGWILTSE